MRQAALHYFGGIDDACFNQVFHLFSHRVKTKTLLLLERFIEDDRSVIARIRDDLLEGSFASL